MERFCDESLERWIEDLKWASDDAKVHSLLKHIFSRRTRLSRLTGFFVKRVIELYWRSGFSTPEIAAQFGVGKERVRAVVKALRREARRFFGDGQVPQPSGQEPQSEPASVHAESWATFFEGDNLAKKPRFQRLTKTTAPRKQIGTKVIEIDGRTFQVRIFEPGRPNGCFRFWAQPRTKQAGPDRQYDSDETKGILAHIPTARDVEAAIDGDQEAREFLEQYNQVRDSKSNPLRDGWSNPPKIMTAPQSTPRPIAERQEVEQECVRCKKKSLSVLIYADGATLQRCESKSCTYMAVWKATPKHKHEHERVDTSKESVTSGLRSVPFSLSQNPMNYFMTDLATEGTPTHAP